MAFHMHRVGLGLPASGRGPAVAMLWNLLLQLAATPAASTVDWLVTQPNTPAALTPWSKAGRSGLTLSNGLISRQFVLDPAARSWATTDFVSHLEDFGTAANVISPRAHPSCG